MSWLLWVSLSPAWGHVANIASYNLDAEHGQSVLRVSLPTSGMHQTLKLAHPGLAELDTAAYQELVAQSLHQGIALQIDGQAADLGKCQVTLGSHETHAICPVAAPAAQEKVSARIDAFQVQSGQSNVLRVLTHPQAGHVVLKQANAFEGTLALVESAPEADPLPSQEPDSKWPWAWGSLLLFPAFFGAWTLSSRPKTPSENLEKHGRA